jgi:hypothetical protein
MGVNKSKPKGTSRLFEKKIEDAITQAKKNVQNSQERIEKLKTRQRACAKRFRRSGANGGRECNAEVARNRRDRKRTHQADSATQISFG